MLKQRLIFGILMTASIIGLLLIDGFLDGSLSEKTNPILPFKGIVSLAIFLAAIIPAVFEIKKLFKNVSCNIFTVPVMFFTLITGSFFFWKQLLGLHGETALLVMTTIIACCFWAVLIWQFKKFKIQNMIINCSANFFAMAYLGFFTAYILGIRIDFGLWPVLMYIFTVKSTDIGAYTFGKIFGKHKFAPSISPGKTWEGMMGGIVFAIITSCMFAHLANIMSLWAAIIFGVGMAFLGQLSDLAESMIKRDAQQKDSAGSVPGFGGVLDVIDSLLLASPIAYAYMWYFTGK